MEVDMENYSSWLAYLFTILAASWQTVRLSCKNYL